MGWHQNQDKKKPPPHPYPAYAPSSNGKKIIQRYFLKP